MHLKTGIDCQTGHGCDDNLNCKEGYVSDFCIKRNDTKPSFKINIEDCNGPIEEDDDIIIEVNMWSKGKLKKNLEQNDNYFFLADNIGFDQIMVDDVIVTDQIRSPEHMKVIGFDELNKAVFVERGLNNTVARDHAKGTELKIFRAKNIEADIEYDYEEVLQSDGTIKKQLVNTLLVCNWNPNMTCLPGCYWLEFKMIKMNLSLLDNLISFIPKTLEEYKCNYSSNIEWIRRFPLEKEGFLIRIINTPTIE
jgi:hypothetical protein